MPDAGTLAEFTGGGLGVALVGAVSGWLISRRTKSGRIDTSEASRLWDASETFRKDLTGQLAEVRANEDRLLAKNEALLAEVAALRAEVAALRAERGKERAEADAWWRAQIDELRADAARQHRQEMAAIRRDKHAQEG